MRIVCPNCDAQYEVPAEIMPPEGRDVQCSNCGTTWMQEHPDMARNLTPEPLTEIVSDPQTVPSPPIAPDPEPAPVDAPREETPDLPDPDLDTSEDVIAEPPEPPAAAPVRKALDPEVEDILRQEAAREAYAREVEDLPDPLETQPGLGLHDIDPPALPEHSEREAPEDLARRPEQETAARGRTGSETSEPDQGLAKPAVAAVAAATTVGSRRELLPDIEEINSTLRSKGDRDLAGDDPSPQAPIRQRKKRGFRRGFLFSIVLFLLAILLYVFAPQLASLVPQLDLTLGAYVTFVDGLRLTLGGWVQSALQWFDSQAAASGG
ncbi:MAG: zinc-ribbon domain-containing protein [Paracoccaceae bacterium]